MKTKRWRFFLLGCLIALLAGGCENTDTVPVQEGTTVGEAVSIGDSFAKNRTEVVLVLDESGSMLKSDPERVAIEACKMFIDLEKASGASISVVEFSDTAKEIPLIDVSDQENKEYLKGLLGDIDYNPVGNTDTGAALMQAANVLDTSDAETKKAVVLFTDGHTEVIEKVAGRTKEDSRKDIEQAVAAAREQEYSIYCVGLNGDGSVNESELRDIALATGGKYLITNDVNELPDFFDDIFMDIGNITGEEIKEFDADGGYETVNFTVENDSALEANLVLLSGKRLEDFSLTDPSGQSVDLTDNERAYFSSSEKYSVLKIFYPQRGTWEAQVKGAEGDHIKISLLYSYDLNLVVEMSPVSMRVGDSLTVDARLAGNGENVDNEFYSALQGYVVLTTADGGEENRYPLALSAAGDCLTVDIPIEKKGSYQAAVHVEGNGMYRDSEPAVIEVSGEPVWLIEEPGNVEIVKNKEKELKLDKYFLNPEEGEIAYRAETESGQIEAAIEQDMLVLKSTETGEGIIKIYADNGNGEETEATLRVKCVAVPAAWLIAGGAAVLLIGVIILLVAIKKMARRISGCFKVHIYLRKTDENFDVVNTITASALGKRRFRFGKLLKLSEAYLEHLLGGNEEKKERIKEALEKAIPDANRIMVSGLPKPFSIRIRKNGGRAALAGRNGEAEGRSVMDISIPNDARFRTVEQEFAVCFHEENEKMWYMKVTVKYRKM